MTVNVTAHAIIRYFERIDGVDMAEIRQRMRAMNMPEQQTRGDATVLSWMGANGYPVEAVRSLFSQPMVERAIAVGATRVRVDANVWAQINQNSKCVASCLTDDMARPHGPERQRKETPRPYYPGKTKRKWRK